ncbi:MAG: methyltransferase domain-containing protein [Limnothrix sp. RL_2_0]|nr:methyltransferase domain-containing protein [Limnothrix sp. RL_2_0]
MYSNQKQYSDTIQDIAPNKLTATLYQLLTLGMKKGLHITRYFMYCHFEKYAEPRPKDIKVLSISHSEKLAMILGFEQSQIFDASYPDYNILDLPFADGEFDAVISDQVLEHVEGSPQQAINELFSVLKPNGIALHTTCFINPVHGCPYDFWRFTPEALKLLTVKHGETLDCGGWGNFYVWLMVGAGLRFQPIPHAKWHPAHWIATYNDPDWPIATWIFTKKNNCIN